MGDYLLREIDRIGRMIEAVMEKLRLRRNTHSTQVAGPVAVAELMSELGLDLEQLASCDDPVATLCGEYGYSPANLQQLSELLDVATDPQILDPSTQRCRQLSQGISRYMEQHHAAFSFTHYCYAMSQPCDNNGAVDDTVDAASTAIYRDKQPCDDDLTQ